MLKPVPTPGPIVVHISGQVVNPGVYSLAVKSRIQDAVEAAGGLTDLADESRMNLAAVLTDGQKILIPTKSIYEDKVDDQPSSSQVIFPIDLNYASQIELESLPDIGPKTAQAILEYRQEHGFFKFVDELEDVPGIGPATMAKIKDLVTVSP